MLETLELFSSLNPHELTEIAGIAKRAEFKRGEIIFQQGDVSRDLYAIESGQVEISTRGMLQEVKLLATLKNGDLFGEMALFDPNSVRSATATATQTSMIIVIPGAAFERLLKEKPGISFKLLGTLSQRLKESNSRTAGVKAAPQPGGRVIAVGAPRNGSGKTTFALTMAHLLSQETAARVLYVDLDLPYADGTFFLGVYSVRTIIEFAAAIRQDIKDFEGLKKHVIQVAPSLYCLPGPVNIVDGEKLDPPMLVPLIKTLKKFFDYIIIDTDSRIDDLFLTAMDLADRVFFVVDGRTSYAIKSSARYFYGLQKLNLAESRLSLFMARSSEKHDLKALSQLLKFKVVGHLPTVENYEPQGGQTVYQVQPAGEYCGALRGILEGYFQVEFQSRQQKGFLSRFFANTGDDGKTAAAPVVAKSGADGIAGDSGLRDNNMRVLLRYVRAGMVAGNIAEAKSTVLKLVEVWGTSSMVYQTFGEILMQEHNPSEAIDALRKAVNLDPANHLAMGYAAILCADKAEFEKALKLLKSKIDLHPTWPDLQKDLGELLLRHGDLQEAQVPLRQALSINPRYAEARLRLAETLWKLGGFDEAIRELLNMKLKDAPSFYLLGVCLHAIHRSSEALEAFNHVIAINPSYQDTQARLAELKAYFDRINNLIDMHRRICREQPAYPDIHVKLAQLLVLVGQRVEAQKECREALRLNPNYQGAKEELEKILAIPDLLIDWPASIDHPGHPCHGTVCHGFQVELQFGAWTTEALEKERLARHVVCLKNIRTGKEARFQLPAAIERSLTTSVGICPVTENDIILVKLMNPQTGEVLFTNPYLISADADPLCKISLDLEAPLKSIAAHLPLMTPVRNFLVTADLQTLGVPESGSNNGLQVTLSNERTKSLYAGRRNLERSREWFFVLSSNDGTDVVQSGDLLELLVENAAGGKELTLQCRVTPTDIEAFTKNIGVLE
jgi:CRP/FNR family transcriptional regulator